MKKIFSIAALMCIIFAQVLTSCSKEDEIEISKEELVGTWDVVWAEEDGESIDIPEGYIYMTLNSDNTYKTVMFQDYYIGTYEIKGSTIVGTTKDPITEYYTFTELNGKNASIDYSNSVGEKYRFRATKR